VVLSEVADSRDSLITCSGKEDSRIYKEDEGKEIRKSHENPEVKQIYDEFLKKPLGEKSHHLLHTKYKEREKV
jgi:iron only hydrogenase large subunit-like protein